MKINVCFCIPKQFKVKICKGWKQFFAIAFKQSHLYFILLKKRADPFNEPF